jgi:hypothetical protein
MDVLRLTDTHAMLPKHPMILAPASTTRPGDSGTSDHRGGSGILDADPGRPHWLCAELVLYSVAAVGTSPLSPSVVDVEGELAFWRAHYQRTATWHRDILPFDEYVPAFTLGISLFLQCHDYLLEALDEQRLAPRYARLRRHSRVEWHEARQAVRAGYLRLQQHQDDAPSGTAESLAAAIAPSLPLRLGARTRAHRRPQLDRRPTK